MSRTLAFLTPADRRLLAQARRRGPEALEKLAWALSGRVTASMEKREQLRKLFMESDEDMAWPPPFIQKKIKLPKSDAYEH
jgi:hypothetical protein